ncbi:MAG: glycosyltransferase family 4 protein [Candidatus Abawacabacteria bacterium]|nr:glycosyltransferase family 4 protein [Candidatus Abawacabacteria bacterium]
MRIGIDARLYSSRFGGVGRYTQELIDHLARIDQENEYILFFNEEDYSQYLAPNARFSKRRVTAKKDTFQEQTSFVKDLHREQLDVMHFTNLDVPVFYKKPSIVTIHNLSAVKFPDPKKQGFFQKIQQGQMISNVITNARRIITVSQVVKEDAIKMIGAPVDRIRIIPKAISEHFQSEVYDQKLAEALKIKLGIKQKYILHVGFWRNYSNLINLIKAYNLFRNRYNNDNQLVIVGKPNDDEDAVRQVVTELGLGDHVILAGFVDDRDLPLLYREAHMYVHAVLEDGFGTSVLEAMASKVPVACAMSGALSETIGPENAVYFEAQDITNLAEALHLVFDDEATRKKLQQRGVEQVQKYSWTDTAEKTMAVYREVAQELGIVSNSMAPVGLTGMATSALGSMTKMVQDKAQALGDQGKNMVKNVGEKLK